MTRSVEFTVGAKIVMGLLVIAWMRLPVLGVPVAPGSNTGAALLRPEPKEYEGAGGGGSASAFVGSGGEKCPPLRPVGSMTFSGAGEIIIDGKVQSLVVGDSASKPDFAWMEDPLAPVPRPVNAPPPTQWICGGGAAFEKGFVYDVTVSFIDRVAACGAITTVAKPASVGGGIFVRTNAAGSGTLFIPRIKTTTAATANSNPNKWRKKIGVGEIVDWSLLGIPGSATVDWAVTGSSGGCTIVGSGSSASFTAGDEETNATITATFVATFNGQQVTGASDTVLVIVKPASVTGTNLDSNATITNLPPEYINAILDLMARNGVTRTAAAGAYLPLKWHFLPDDVSFLNIKWKELACPKENALGVFRVAGDGHPENPYESSVQENNDQASYDVVFQWTTATEQNFTTQTFRWFGLHPTSGAVEPGGSFRWNIPWKWKLKDRDDFHDGGVAPMDVSVTENGSMTIEKLGVLKTEPPIMWQR